MIIYKCKRHSEDGEKIVFGRKRKREKCQYELRRDV